ncbi:MULTISPECIES: response regulator [unclassified Azospirillum]|uniref:response regulator n=1 Tax=unclassified Azospirillum TaxID=2630922 RepID=UPI000B6C5FD6|nr:MULTISPECIES: response regulator [unclassified Azospirillum]SNS69556.1 PAS domain S-box-containing protein [Azospirillum sp. RU38E]SNS87565.1 PAS domain S-box-containing protein [Azospirillum sp. RU37A]
MRLRYLIPLLILALALGFLAMAVVDIFQSWREKRSAEDFMRSDAARGTLLLASADWALERGLGYLLLFNEAPVPPEKRAELAAIAARADGYWRQAVAALEEPGGAAPISPHTLLEMKQTIVIAEDMRARVAEALRQPRAQRPADLHERWFAAMTGVIDQSGVLRFQALVAIPIDDMRIASQSWLKQYSWIAAEYAGRERALIAGAIAGGPPLASVQPSLIDANARHTWAWNGIENMARAGIGDVEGLVAEARRVMTTDVAPARHDAMQWLNSPDFQPAMTKAEAWFAAATRGIDSLLAIQRAASIASANRATDLARIAARDLLASILLLLFGMGLTMLALLLAHYRLLRPLAELTDLFEKIARGRTDLTVPDTRRHDEVGELARAAAAFRETHLDGRRMADELRRREHLLGLFISHTPTAIAMLDHDMRYLAVSRRWLSEYGLEGRNVIGLSYYDLFPETDERWRAIHRACLGGKTAASQEDRLVGGDGTVNWLRWEIHPWHDIDGRVGGIIIFTEFITERKEAESEIRHLATHLQVMLDSADAAFISTDVDGTIQIFNRGAERMLGYEAHELIGRQTPVLFHDPAELAGVLNRLRQEGIAINSPFEALVHDARQGRPSQREWTMVDRDGNRFPALLSVNALRSADGQIQGFLGIANNISQLREADRLKAEFISTVSHELRTPLTAIRASLGMVNSGLFGDLPEEARQLTDIAQQSTERLIRLINDLLDIEKIASGKMRFEMKPHQLRTLLRQTVQDNEALAGRAGVTLQLEEGLSEATVQGDADRLVQTFTNLVSNAVKFSPAGSSVRISVTGLRPNWVRVSIIDQGCGIPEEFRPRIFQRFAQADSSDSRAKGGTGLGLAITREIVERHGGQVSFETTVGNGTRFHVDLPVLDDLPVTALLADDEAEAGAAMPAAQVLVCEDDPDIARLLGLMLSQAGFEAVLATDGEEALRLLRERRFDAMTLDLLLPDVSGLTLFDKIRALPAGRDLPIIIVSAIADQGRETLNGEAVGIIDWLAKPIDPDRLIRAIGRAIARPGNQKPLLLHVEDDADMRLVVQRVLSRLADIVPAASMAEARKAAAAQHFDLAIIDIDMPDGSGLDVIPLLRDRAGGPVPVVVFTGADIDLVALRQVAATLVKSRARSDDLVETIQGLIQRLRQTGQGPAGASQRAIPPEPSHHLEPSS